MTSHRSSVQLLVASLLVAALFASFISAAPAAEASPRLQEQNGTVPTLKSEFELPPDQVHYFNVAPGSAALEFGLDYYTPNEPFCDDPARSNGCFGKNLDLTLIDPNGVEYTAGRSYTYDDIPIGELGWLVPAPAPGQWTAVVNARGFYTWYDIPYAVFLATTCHGARITIDMNTNGGNGTGTPGDDVIWGTPGPDQIAGNGGNDLICAGAGDDVILGGPGRDSIRGGPGADTIFGGSEIDRIWGEGGPDTIHGDGGSDRIWGGASNDLIHAGSGADRVYGGPGDDDLRGMGGQDFMRGDSGNDIMQGNFQSDRLYGGPGNDIIRGAEGKDKLYGEGGHDQLFGGNNTDFLDGGPGNDVANGQRGKDNPYVAGVSGCDAETRVSC